MNDLTFPFIDESSFPGRIAFIFCAVEIRYYKGFNINVMLYFYTCNPENLLLYICNIECLYVSIWLNDDVNFPWISVVHALPPNLLLLAFSWLDMYSEQHIAGIPGINYRVSCE